MYKTDYLKCQERLICTAGRTECCTKFTKTVPLSSKHLFSEETLKPSSKNYNCHSEDESAIIAF